jgi:hypothetical protein
VALLDFYRYTSGFNVKAAKTQTLIAHAAFLGCWPLGDAGAAPGTYYPHIRRNNSEKSIVLYG